MMRLLITVSALVVACGCQVKETSTGGNVTVIRPDTPETTLIARADVLSEGERVGRVRTFRFGDDAERFVTRVYDTRERPLGYITPEGKAYRVRAHGGADLIAVGATVEKNVAVILGMPDRRIELKPAKTRDQGK